MLEIAIERLQCYITVSYREGGLGAINRIVGWALSLGDF
jgi:hypothetical protein